MTGTTNDAVQQLSIEFVELTKQAGEIKRPSRFFIPDPAYHDVDDDDWWQRVTKAHRVTNACPYGDFAQTYGEIFSKVRDFFWGRFADWALKVVKLFGLDARSAEYPELKCPKRSEIFSGLDVAKHIAQSVDTNVAGERVIFWAAAYSDTKFCHRDNGHVAAYLEWIASLVAFEGIEVRLNKLVLEWVKLAFDRMSQRFLARQSASSSPTMVLLPNASPHREGKRRRCYERDHELLRLVEEADRIGEKAKYAYARDKFNEQRPNRADHLSPGRSGRDIVKQAAKVARKEREQHSDSTVASVTCSTKQVENRSNFSTP